MQSIKNGSAGAVRDGASGEGCAHGPQDLFVNETLVCGLSAGHLEFLEKPCPPDVMMPARRTRRFVMNKASQQFAIHDSHPTKRCVTMADLSQGTYMLSNIQWKKRDDDAALRPVRGFTTGKLHVHRRKSRVEARFTDQNLSNRFNDLEEDGVYVTLQVAILGDEGVYVLPGWAPTLERAGACYVLRVQGWTDDVRALEGASQ